MGCDFDVKTAFEVELKGWFDAATARLPDGVEIPLAFRDPVRLSQDLEAEVSAGRSCVAEPALIVIPKVTRKHLEAAVAQLYESGFFDQLAGIVRKVRIRTGERSPNVS